jgi:hypothetical protein
MVDPSYEIGGGDECDKFRDKKRENMMTQCSVPITNVILANKSHFSISFGP